MRLPPLKHCQTALCGLLFIAGLLAAAALWQLNQRGFSGQWSERLEKELTRLGLHAEFSTARLSWSRGLVAKDLKIYADKAQTTLLASCDVLELDIDRNAALRNDWVIRSARFDNAFLALPDHCHPHHLRELSGHASLSRDGIFTVTQGHGKLGKLAINLEVLLTDFDLSSLLAPRGADDQRNPAHQFVAQLQDELQHWQSDGGTPLLTAKVSGKANDPKSISARFQLTAPRLRRKDYLMQELTLAGRATASAIDFEHLNFQDGAGSLTTTGYYDYRKRIADFECQSTIDLSRLLHEGLGRSDLKSLTFRKAPEIRARGKARFFKRKPAQLHLTGHITMQDFGFLDENWQSLDSDFSWQAGDLLLRDLNLQHAEGRIIGKLLFQNDNVRYKADTTLPVRVFNPFIKNNGDIANIVAQARFNSDSKVRCHLKGNIRLSDLTDWAAAGKAEFLNFRYNNTPINRLTSTFNLTPLQAIYLDTKAELDLREDWSRKKFGGPPHALVTAAQITYENSDKLTQLNGLETTCWPAPILKLFDPKLAHEIERTYRSTAPPKLSASGVIDHLPPFHRSSFDTRFTCTAPLLYDFLGRTLVVEKASALIESRWRKVNVKNLNAYTFSGPIKGDIAVRLPAKEGPPPDFFGNVRWTRLRLPEIGALYGYEKIEHGLVTGRFDFKGKADRIETLQGVGNIGLEQGELFRAPIFGPLSPLIASIQGHEKASHDVARDASANFIVDQGILYTNDFITSTDSLTVRAQGSIDLARTTLDITAQADTHGLLGLVTLPLNITPFKTLFQFHGTGPVSSPTWVNTLYAHKGAASQLPLVPPTSKGIVIPE